MMASNQCSYAKCGESEELVERQSERNGDIYTYCPDHDPLESDHAFAFAEVSDDE